MERKGFVLGLKAEQIAEYKRVHAAVWPEVLDIIARANIRNYTIFLREPENLLFAYYEYHGTDFAADMARLGAEPKMKEWWVICDPMQTPLSSRKPGEWWVGMENVFHTD